MNRVVKTLADTFVEGFVFAAGAILGVMFVVWVTGTPVV